KTLVKLPEMSGSPHGRRGADHLVAAVAGGAATRASESRGCDGEEGGWLCAWAGPGARDPVSVRGYTTRPGSGPPGVGIARSTTSASPSRPYTSLPVYVV